MARQGFLTPLVSVVVPAFQVGAHLADTVESVFAAFEDVEVIIVDDCATDASGAVADELASDPRVTVVHRRRNGGPAVARNDGLRRARGTFVLFLDGDDRLTERASALVRALDDPTTVAALGRFRAVNDVGEPLDIGTWAAEQLRPVVRRDGRYLDSPDGFTEESLLTRLVTPPPGGVLARRDAVLAVGGFDPEVRRSEDLELWVRLVRRGRFVAVDDVVLDYRRSPGQRSGHVRRRRQGRQRTLVRLVRFAPDRTSAAARRRGVVAHHLDRATTRWRFGHRRPADAIAAARSLALAVGFEVAGRFIWWSARGANRVENVSPRVGSSHA